MAKKNIYMRCLAFLLVLLVSLSCIDISKISIAKNKDETKATYIVKLNQESNTRKWKDSFKTDNKLKVRHKENDDKFLENSNILVVDLTETEVAELKKNSDFVNIEADMTLNALSLISNEVENNDILNEEWDQDSYPIFPNIDECIEDINFADDSAVEFTDQAEEFIPCDPITDESKKTEVLPWNIEVVAGNPENNQYRGEGVKIAIIDSGIAMHHDLNTMGWIDFSDYVHGYKPVDNSGHGTQMAGVINARINGFGMVGIASDAEVYSIKILNEDNSGSLSNVVKAIEWCIDNDIDVINMSFGMNTYSRILEDEINKAYENNIMMVAAAGNTSENGSLQYPARYCNVIAVGAIDKEAKVADFQLAEENLIL